MSTNFMIDRVPEDQASKKRPKHNILEDDLGSQASQAFTLVADGVLLALSHWKILVFGQALSFLLAATGATSATLHLECNMLAPAFQASWIYYVLSFHLVPIISRARRGEIELPKEPGPWHFSTKNKAVEPRYHFMGLFPLHAPVWIYAVLGFLDVQGNYLTYLAFRYTTLTSVTLFDALAIPSAMAFSRVLLGRRYTFVHLFGAAVCMMGVVFNVLSDYESDKIAAAEQASGAGYGETTVHDGSNEYPHKFLGDALAIAGGLLYGLNDVLAEMVVRNFGGQEEFLGMLGFMGSMVAFFQVILLERRESLKFFGFGIEEEDAVTCPLSTGWILLFTNITTASLGYLGVARFLTHSEAALLNLSLLTGDLWSVIFSVVLERIIPQPLFWVALSMIISGVFIYEIAPSPIVEKKNQTKRLKPMDWALQGQVTTVPPVTTVV